MTQSQIAEELGISQMHVSRLLSRTLADLRKALEEPARSSRRDRSERARSSAAGLSQGAPARRGGRSRRATTQPRPGPAPTATTVVEPPQKLPAPRGSGSAGRGPAARGPRTAAGRAARRSRPRNAPYTQEEHGRGHAHREPLTRQRGELGDARTAPAGPPRRQPGTRRPAGGGRAGTGPVSGVRSREPRLRSPCVARAEWRGFRAGDRHATTDSAIRTGRVPVNFVPL